MSGVIDVTTRGVPGDGSDVTLPLWALVNGATTPTVLRFPAGNYVLTEPVVCGNPAVSFAGDGTQVTRIGFGAGLWFGPLDGDNGGTLDPSRRPSCDGVLDQTARGKFGFRTGGDCIAVFQNHPFVMGGRSPLDAAVADGYGDLQGLTWQACLTSAPGQTYPASWPLFSVGPFSDCVWWVGFVPGTDPAHLRLTVVYRLAGDDDAPNVGFRQFGAQVPNSGTHRFRVWMDLQGGRVGIAADGADLPCDGQTTFPAGSRLLRTRGRNPAILGAQGVLPPAGPVPDVVFNAMSVHGTAIRTEPADDHHRYFDTTDPTLIQCLEGALPRTATRLFPTLGPGGVRHWGWCYTTTGTTRGGCGSNAVTDLTIQSPGVALGLGDVLDFRAERCVLQGGTHGVAWVGRICAYPITLRDLWCYGTADAGVSLGFCTQVTLDRVNVGQAGTTAARFVACDVDWRGGQMTFSSGATRLGFASLCAPYGETVRLQSLQWDNEGGGFIEGLLYAEQQPYGPAYLSVDSVDAAVIAPGTPYLRLRGFAGPVFSPARFRITGGNVKSGGGIQVDAGWTGSADMAGQSVKAVTGSGAAGVTT